MTDLPAPSGDEDAVDPAVSRDGEGLALAHDPQGLDLASRIAATARSMQLPPVKPAWQAKRGRRRPVGDPDVRSGAGPDARDPQPLGVALQALLARQGWTREVNLRTLLHRWPELVGVTNADHSRPEAFRDGVVVVRAESNAWASSLRLLAPNLVAELNRRLGDGTVKRIEVQGPAAPSWKHGIRAVRDGRGPRDTYG